MLALWNEDTKEITLRFGKLPPNAKPPLIWDEFFSTQAGESSAKYPFAQLLGLDREQLKTVLEEYFYQVGCYRS